MTSNDRFNVIYLNKHDSDSTDDWDYYRITSIGGQNGNPIEAVLVKWPSLTDMDIATDERAASVWTDGITEKGNAYDTILALLEGKWGIKHEKSLVIGVTE